MKLKIYISIFEDGQIQFWNSETLPDVIRQQADDGYYDLLDITNPEEPLEYNEGQWLEFSSKHVNF